jgi:hypothetical protein
MKTQRLVADEVSLLVVQPILRVAGVGHRDRRPGLHRRTQTGRVLDEGCAGRLETGDRRPERRPHVVVDRRDAEVPGNHDARRSPGSGAPCARPSTPTL